MLPDVSLPRLDELVSPGHRFLFGMGVIFGHAMLLPLVPGAAEGGLLVYLLSPFAFLLPPVLLVRGVGAALRESLALYPVAHSQLGWSLLAGVGMVPAMGILGALNAQWIEPSPEVMEMMDALVPDSTAGWLGMIFAVAVLTPLGEELLFRGLLQDAATPSLGPAPAAVTVGLIFAAVHFQPWYLLPLSVIGMTLGLVRMITGSVLACAALHGAYNLGMLLLGRLEESAGDESGFSVIVLLVFAVSGLWTTWHALGRLRPAPGTLMVQQGNSPQDRP